jgi:Mg-chelatase subunit ChlI
MEARRVERAAFAEEQAAREAAQVAAVEAERARIDAVFEAASTAAWNLNRAVARLQGAGTTAEDGRAAAAARLARRRRRRRWTPARAPAPRPSHRASPGASHVPATSPPAETS